MSIKIRLHGNKDKARGLVHYAKLRLAVVKQAMSFQGLKQLYPATMNLPDGSTVRVGSVFGIDYIDIYAKFIPGGGTKEVESIKVIDIIFLVYRDGATDKIATWYLDENEVLVPFSYTGFTGDNMIFFDTGTKRWGSCVESNIDELIHYYTDETDDVGYTLNYARYGCLSGSAFDILVGLRNCFIGGVFDTSMTYIGGGDTNRSGRRSAYVDDAIGSEVKNCVCRDIGGGEVRVYYTIGTTEYTGATHTARWTLTDGAVSATKIWGAYGPGGISDVITPYGSASLLECSSTLGCTDEQIGYTPCNTRVKTTTGNEVLFGDIHITTIGTETISDLCNWPVICNCYGEGMCAETQATTVGYQEIWTTTRVVVLAHDTLDFDTEGTFMAIYAQLGTRTYSLYLPGGGKCGGFTDYTHSFDAEEIVLIYRLENGTVVKYQLALSGNTYWNLSERGDTTSWCATACGTSSVIDELARSWRGDKLTNLSCKISLTHLIYSYQLNDFTAEDTWTYNSRVIGTINRITGEHTINVIDAPAGFDFGYNSAVGMHHGVTKTIEEVPINV